MLDVLTAVVPSVGVGILFFIAIRAILRADRREREAIDAMQNELPNGGRKDTPGDH